MRSSVLAALVTLALAGCADAAAGGPRASPRAAPATAHRTPTSTGAPPVAPSPNARTVDAFALRPAPWSAALDALIDGRSASVSVAIDGRLRFSHRGDVPRTPASNEKLVLSMALLDTFGPRSRIATAVETMRPIGHDGVIRGDVWIVGHGDPEVDNDAIARLARLLAKDGVEEIAGSAVGDTSTFRRDRWAPGWHRIALSYVSIPTALTFNANADASGFVLDPEREAAAAMTSGLVGLGVVVHGRPTAGAVPAKAGRVARIRSAPLVDLLRDQNLGSVNLDAEVLGKRLAAVGLGRPPSIADGARAIERWAGAHGVEVIARDASGLSYANRITTDGMVRLLSIAEDEPWAGALRSTLPRAGEGTLGGRLTGIVLRAKTGTLIGGISALSGWVRLRDGRWAAFSILSAHMAKDDAITLEDAVVRFLAERA